MAAEIFSLGNRIRVAAAKESRKDRHILTIASIPVMAQYNITGVLAKFQQQFPQITLDVAECEQHDLYAMLRDGRCELAFTRRAGSGEPDMEYLPFAQDHLVAVMPETHPLANSAQLRLQDLKDQPLLCLDQRTGLYNLCTSLCLQAGFQPDFVYTGHRPENIVGLAAQNMGVALLMQRHTNYVHLQDVVTIDVSPGWRAPFVWFARRASIPAAWARASGILSKPSPRRSVNPDIPAGNGLSSKQNCTNSPGLVQ